MALQHDGSERNKCTCFLFLKPTSMVRALVENWRDAIAKDRKVTNQVSTVVDVRAENVAAHIVLFFFFSGR